MFLLIKRSFVTSLVLLCTSLSVGAEQWQRLTTADGLDNNQTRQIICLPDGRMLAVVEGAIDVFDGQQFQSLPMNRTRASSVHSFLNTNHYLDAQGRLWIRSLHELTALNVHTLEQMDVRHWLREAGVTGHLQNFFMDPDGTAWIHVGEDSLLRYDGSSAARLVLRIQEQNPDSLRSSICDIVGVDGCHYVLFSSGRMTCIDDVSGKARYTTNVGNPRRGYYLRAVSFGKDLIIRVADDDGQNQLRRFNTRTRMLTDTLLLGGAADLRVTGDGNLWVCNSRNIWRFGVDSRVDFQCDDAPTDLQSFAIDLQGGVWACTANSGLLYRTPLSAFIPYQSSTGAVYSFLEGPDGMVVAATSRGLLRRTPVGHWQPVEDTQGMHAVRLDSDGRGGLYVSTRNQGLVALDSDLRPRWRIDEGMDSKMRNNVDFCVALPSGQRLFNCRLNRLVVLDPETRQMNHLMERLTDGVQEFRRIVDIVPVDGGWLVATQNGLFFLQTLVHGSEMDFQINTQRFAKLSDNAWSQKCNCLMRDNDGHILVGTQNGLLVYEEQQATLRHFGVQEGLPSSCIQSITTDKQGFLWMTTLKGLCRLNLQTRETLIFDATDGVRDQTFCERAALRLTDGHLLFGTEHGIYTIAPDTLPIPIMNLVPRLLGVHVAGNDSILRGIGDIQFPYNQNFLTFSISALNYANPTHTHYRYRLRGIDPDWVTVADGRGRLELTYTALPPGRYHLEAQAAMQGQPWGESMHVDITIRPPFWRTWWAYILYLLLCTSLFFYIRRSYVLRKEMHRRIEELLREREIAANEKGKGRNEKWAEQMPEEDPEKEEIGDEDKSDTVKSEGESPSLTPDARRFLEKAIRCVDSNMSNTEFTIDDFASEMAMERSTLYRRLQAVMGQSPLEFLRTIRLKRAAELLRSGKYSITEVSELVGFNTPRYFTKHFKEMYGVRPSEYR